MNEDLLARLAPVPRTEPLIPPLTPQADLALLCRTLFTEGYDDHIAGHVTLKQGDGTILCSPWELAWDELRARDVIRLDAQGRVVEGDWNVTPAIGLHLAIHAHPTLAETLMEAASLYFGHSPHYLGRQPRS